MNKIILYLLLSVLPSISLGRMRESTAFDYIGPSTNILAENASSELNEENSRVLFSEIECKSFFPAEECMFLSILTLAEVAYSRNLEHDFRRWMTIASNYLRFQNESVPLIGDALFVRNRLHFEYSLSRFINKMQTGDISITPDDVRRWLPSTQQTSLAENQHIIRQERFRTLLILGSGVMIYLKKEGRLPPSLEKIKLEDEIGLRDEDKRFQDEEVVYQCEGDFWKLRIGKAMEKEPLYEFLPAIDRISGLKCDLIWFSSAFTQKRKELFDKGYLRNVDIRCSGYIKDGILYRGRPRKKE
jgi:hypothetical protein